MSQQERDRRAAQRRASMTVEEAAYELGICRNAAYQAVKEGQIPSLRVGRRIIVPRAAFEKMMEAAS